jgi:predicted ABC-class ATPase
VSAFISNLPGTAKTAAVTATDVTVDRAGGGEAEDAVPDFLDARTWSFGTKDASGSTSQAANNIEAIKSGALALLVDEELSAVNFMACDGRMRAMIMDKPITPLLYRVNGLFLSKEHGTSTIVVVGGVGEWLDVANAMILMRDYEVHDGLAKARSVSYQFLCGHIQYADVASCTACRGSSRRVTGRIGGGILRTAMMTARMKGITKHRHHCRHRRQRL